MAQEGGAPSATAPDQCTQARADWPRVERSASASVLLVYRDILPAACVEQRALVDARLRELGAAHGNARVWYACDNTETVRVTFDYANHAAVLSRYARRDLRLIQIDANVGFRYIGGDAIVMEGAGRDLNIAFGAHQHLTCRQR